MGQERRELRDSAGEGGSVAVRCPKTQGCNHALSVLYDALARAAACLIRACDRAKSRRVSSPTSPAAWFD